MPAYDAWIKPTGEECVLVRYLPYNRVTADCQGFSLISFKMGPGRAGKQFPDETVELTSRC